MILLKSARVVVFTHSPNYLFCACVTGWTRYIDVWQIISAFWFYTRRCIHTRYLLKLIAWDYWQIFDCLLCNDAPCNCFQNFWEIHVRQGGSWRKMWWHGGKIIIEHFVLYQENEEVHSWWRYMMFSAIPSRAMLIWFTVMCLLLQKISICNNNVV